MRSTPKLFLLSSVLIILISSTPARADVIVDMPPPPQDAKKTTPDTAADSATVVTTSTGTVDVSSDNLEAASINLAATGSGSTVVSQPAASPTVGDVALVRYSRYRLRPTDTYYIGSRHFAGYVWPQNHYWGWGPYYYNWGGLWPGWTWGRWNINVNCNDDTEQE